MESKKIAVSAAAALALSGSFVAGQIAGKPVPEPHIVGITFEPVPAATIVVKGSEGVRRRRLTCGPTTTLDGKSAPALAPFCDTILVFAKTASDKVKSATADLSK